MSHGFFADAVNYGLFFPAQALVLLTAVALLLRITVKPWWAWTATGLGLLALVLRTCVDWPNGCDTRWFWLAGLDVVAGIDPYRNEFCLTPPTGLPVFYLFALFPFDQTLLVWTVLNLAGVAVLVMVARAAIRSAGTGADWDLPAPAVGVLTAALALSVSCGYGIGVGQMALFTTLMILGALWARNRGRAVLAGAGLALATIKVGTMLPFLMLFRRRYDRRSWATLAAGCLGLYLLTSPLLEMPTRLSECLRNIAVMGAPGHMNNFTHPVCFDLIGFDRAIYFLGVDDRTAVRLGQYSAVLALGVWVGWLVLRKSDMSEAARCALVAFFASLFLYHRLYDMPILVLPLAYAMGRARVTIGRQRWLYVASVAAVLAVLYLRLETVKVLGAQPRGEEVLSRLVQALVVPYGVWLTLVGLICLTLAEGCPRRAMVLDEPLPLAA
jgi:Glycosyltransferase family 87